MSGDITNVSNLTTTTLTATNLNLSNFTATTVNSTTLNTTTVNATGDIACRDIDCKAITGGSNNSAGNFHIDNTTASGEMFINYDHNNNLRYGNVPATSLTGGGRFTLFSNQTMPLRLYNNCASTFTTGWTNSIQQDSAFNGAKMIQGFYRSNSITKYTHSILCSIKMRVMKHPFG